MSGLTTAKELRAEVKGLAEEMREIIQNPEGENDNLSADQETKFDRLNERQNELIEQYEEIEAQEEARSQREDAVKRAEEWMKQSRGVQGGKPDTADIDTGGEDRTESPDQEQYEDAFDTWLRTGVSGLDTEQRQVLQSRYVTERGVSVYTPESRAQSIGQDSAGGFIVPDGLMQPITKALKQFGGIRQSRAQVVTTSDGRDIPWPTYDDTSNKGRLLTENSSVSTTDVTFGQAVLHAYGYSSDFIKVPWALLQDSEFDLVGLIGGIAGERIGRITAQHFTTGDGSSKPYGVAEQATSGVTAASATDVAVDEVYELKHSVDPAYRLSGEFMFNDGTLKELKLKKDGDGRPLWQSGIAIGEPNTIDGSPYVVNQEMPDTAASNKAVLYGDFSLYKIRDVSGSRIIRLDERFADNGQVAFLVYSRHDGVLVNAGQGPIKAITMAAS